MAIIDEKIRQLLEQLSRALHTAIGESDDVHEHLDRLREEGYTLNLLLDCQPDLEGPREDRKDLSPRSLRMVHSNSRPEFRINGEDLAFLRSVGIDPTRRLRTRRRGKSSGSSGGRLLSREEIAPDAGETADGDD